MQSADLEDKNLKEKSTNPSPSRVKVRKGALRIKQTACGEDDVKCSYCNLSLRSKPTTPRSAAKRRLAVAVDDEATTTTTPLIKPSQTNCRPPSSILPTCILEEERKSGAPGSDLQEMSNKHELGRFEPGEGELSYLERSLKRLLMISRRPGND